VDFLLSRTFEGGFPVSKPFAVTPLIERLLLHVSALALLRKLILISDEEKINIVIQKNTRINLGKFPLLSGEM
jgi:hypothetical protein